jgi:hypothetical protein
MSRGPPGEDLPPSHDHIHIGGVERGRGALARQLVADPIRRIGDHKLRLRSRQCLRDIRRAGAAATRWSPNSHTSSSRATGCSSTSGTLSGSVRPLDPKPARMVLSWSDWKPIKSTSKLLSSIPRSSLRSRSGPQLARGPFPTLQCPLVLCLPRPFLQEDSNFAHAFSKAPGSPAAQRLPRNKRNISGLGGGYGKRYNSGEFYRETAFCDPGIIQKIHAKIGS